MPLTREEVLQAKDDGREVVPVPEWGGEVIVRSMLSNERDEFEKWYIASSREDGPPVGFSARLAAATVCDESGALLFSLEDVAALELKSSVAMRRIYKVAMRLNKLTKEDRDELEKNSDATIANSSSSS